MSKVTKRKHVTKELQEDLSIPTEKQFIVQHVNSRGNNLHEVIDRSGEKFLVSMPVKFRRNIWVKRGDFVLVEPIAEGDKVKAEIAKILTKNSIKIINAEINREENNAILMPNARNRNFTLFWFYQKEHIKFYRTQDVWPKEFDNKNTENHQILTEIRTTSKDSSDAEEDDLFVNTNRKFEQYNSDNKNTSEDSSSESD